MRLRTAAVLCAIFATASAQASVSVPGRGFAHDCFIAAEHDYGSAFGEEPCTVALQSEPLSLRDRAATFVNRGVIRTKMKRFDEALADYEQAINLGGHLEPPDLGVAYVDRAFILREMGRYREAIDSATKGLSVGTSKPQLGYYVRAVAEEELGDLKAAYYDYKQAVALQPDFDLAARQLSRFRVQIRSGPGA